MGLSRKIFRDLGLAVLVLSLTGCGFLNQFRKSNSKASNNGEQPEDENPDESTDSSFDLQIVIQPTHGVVNTPLFRYPSIEAVDENGDLMEDATFDCTAAFTDGTAFDSTSTEESGNGSAIFDELEINVSAGTYSLVFDCGEYGEFTTDSFTVYEKTDGGAGTLGDPYQVSNLYQLQALAFHLSDYVGDYVKMTADIDASESSEWFNGMGFYPIGTDNSDPFQGYFDGAGKVLAELTINRPDEDYIGLFGALSNGTTVREITISEANITGGSYVGTLSGSIVGANTVTENLVANSTVEGTNYVGGLAGCESGASTVSYTIVEATVSGASRVGGLLGCVTSTTVMQGIAVKAGVTASNGRGGGVIGELSSILAAQQITVTGYVTGGASHLGGFVGNDASSASSLNNIHADVDIRSTVGSGVSGYAGGFAGALGSGVSQALATGDVKSQGTFIGGFTGNGNNYIYASGAMGKVSGHSFVGGLVGNHDNGNIENSFFSGDVQGAATSAGNLIGNFEGGTATRNFFRPRDSSPSTSPTITLCEGTSSTQNAAAADCVSSMTGGTASSVGVGFGPTVLDGMTISSVDAAAFSFAGWCDIDNHGSSITIRVVGSSTVTDSTTCSNGAWRKVMNLASLADSSGGITVTLNPGSDNIAITMNKDTQCSGKNESGEFADGVGSVGDPYLVCTEDQFWNMIARSEDNNNYYFDIGNNIYLSDRKHEPISDDTTCVSRMCDTIDGQSFAIVGLRVVSASSNASLLGYIGTGGSVVNLFVTDAIVVGNGETGILAGPNGSASAFSQIHTTGIVVSASTRAGGVFSTLNASATLTNLYSDAFVNGTGTVGGLIGIMTNGTLSKAIATGHVLGEGALLGGMVGHLQNAGVSISEGKASGMVIGGSSSTHVGGLVGHLDAASITNAYASGQTVSRANYVGGVAGRVNNVSSMTNVYASNNVSTNGGFAGGLAGELSTAGSSINTSFTANDVVQASSSRAILIGDMPAAEGSVSLLAHLPGSTNGLPATLAGTSDISANADAVADLTEFFSPAGVNSEQYWGAEWSDVDDGTDVLLPYLAIED